MIHKTIPSPRFGYAFVGLFDGDTRYKNPQPPTNGVEQAVKNTAKSVADIAPLFTQLIKQLPDSSAVSANDTLFYILSNGKELITGAFIDKFRDFAQSFFKQHGIWFNNFIVDDSTKGDVANLEASEEIEDELWQTFEFYKDLEDLQGYLVTTSGTIFQINDKTEERKPVQLGS